MPVSQAYQGIAGTVFSGLKGERPAPKASALPTALYPDIQFLPLYHGEGDNQRFFCLWSFMWSKPLLRRFRQSKKTPQTQASQGFASFRPHPIPDTATALPKQARYQLRNTPIFNKTPLYYSILGRFRKAFLIMVKIVDWLQKRANFRKTETRRPLCRRDLCCKALLLYRLGGAVARIICGAWSAFLRPWRAHPSWPHAPLRSRRAAFWRSTKRFPPSRPP